MPPKPTRATAPRTNGQLPRALVARVRRFIVDRQLFQPGDRVLAAVSGGADSTCLLLVLAELRRSLKIGLDVAFFDHMVRSRHAIDREQRFVRSLCKRLDVPLHVGAADVSAHQRTKRLSPEEAARELRYEFLASVARESGCVAVATGHTQDDQAETVLLNIIRGTGVRGLAAMAPRAPLPALNTGKHAHLVRPLLALSRADTESCCRSAGVEPMEDKTNRSLAFRRNRVRHELLPLLRQLNPRIEEALVRLSTAAAEDDEIIDHLVSSALTNAEARNGTLRVSRRALDALPESLRPAVVRGAIERLVGSTRSFSERHVTAILRAASTTGTRLDLPHSLSVEVQRDAVLLRAGTSTIPAARKRVRLAVPGTTRFGPWSVHAELLERPPTRVRPANGVATALLDAAALGGAAWLRSRQPGDRYRPLGLGRSKKLQDILVDAHVPRGERDALPLLCAKNGIAWVAGQPPADWAKVTSKTRRAVRIRAERAEA